MKGDQFSKEMKENPETWEAEMGEQKRMGRRTRGKWRWMEFCVQFCSEILAGIAESESALLSSFALSQFHSSRCPMRTDWGSTLVPSSIQLVFRTPKRAGCELQRDKERGRERDEQVTSKDTSLQALPSVMSVVHSKYLLCLSFPFSPSFLISIEVLHRLVVKSTCLLLIHSHTLSPLQCSLVLSAHFFVHSPSLSVREFVTWITGEIRREKRIHAPWGQVLISWWNEEVVTDTDSETDFSFPSRFYSISAWGPFLVSSCQKEWRMASEGAVGWCGVVGRQVLCLT